MKVLFINTVIDYGSTGRLVRDLANGAKQAGHEVKIIYGRKPINDESAQYIGNKFELIIHGLMTKLFDRHGLHSSRSTKKVISHIESFNPDVIHLHNLHGYYLNVPMLLDFLIDFNKPIIWTLHDFWMISGSSASYSYYGCKNWNEGCVENYNPSLYPGSYFIRRSTKNFKWKKEILPNLNDITFVTVSKWQEKELKKSFLKKKAITTIYNGVDTKTFKPKKSKQDSQLKLLAVANEWQESKGLFDLLKLSELLDQNESLTLIGLTNKQIKKYKNYRNIKMIERTNDIYELVEYYQEADVYLNLSYEETMGMTTVEALSCGIPSITYDKTAVPEVITHEVGRVIEAGNYVKVLQEARRLKAINISSHVCRDYAVKNFDKQLMIDKYLSLYEKHSA